MKARVKPNLVQFYSAVEKRLMHPLDRKAFLFFKHGCIQEKAVGVFLCKPLDGYNKTEYVVREDSSFGCGFRCNCQGFQSKLQRGEPPRCSHVDAVHLHLFWKHDLNARPGAAIELSERQTVVV